MKKLPLLLTLILLLIPLVTALPDLSINPTQIQHSGEPRTYQLRITNTGNETLEQITLLSADGVSSSTIKELNVSQAKNLSVNISSQISRNLTLIFLYRSSLVPYVPIHKEVIYNGATFTPSTIRLKQSDYVDFKNTGSTNLNLRIIENGNQDFNITPSTTLQRQFNVIGTFDFYPRPSGLSGLAIISEIGKGLLHNEAYDKKIPLIISGNNASNEDLILTLEKTKIRLNNSIEVVANRVTITAKKNLNNINLMGDWIDYTGGTFNMQTTEQATKIFYVKINSNIEGNYTKDLIVIYNGGTKRISYNLLIGNINSTSDLPVRFIEVPSSTPINDEDLKKILNQCNLYGDSQVREENLYRNLLDNITILTQQQTKNVQIISEKTTALAECEQTLIDYEKSDKKRNWIYLLTFLTLIVLVIVGMAVKKTINSIGRDRAIKKANSGDKVEKE